MFNNNSISKSTLISKSDVMASSWIIVVVMAVCFLIYHRFGWNEGGQLMDWKSVILKLIFTLFIWLPGWIIPLLIALFVEEFLFHKWISTATVIRVFILEIGLVLSFWGFFLSLKMKVFTLEFMGMLVFCYLARILFIYLLYQPEEREELIDINIKK